MEAYFVLHENKYQGQVVIRDIPNFEWYLRIDDGRKKIRSFVLEANPLRVLPLTLVEEPRREKKWLKFEGEIPPGPRLYNPNKEIPAFMRILDEGNVELSIDYDELEREVIVGKFEGKRLKGEFTIRQAERGSDLYVMEEIAAKAESEARRIFPFVLQLHSDSFPDHFDIRIDAYEDALLEWSMPTNPLEAEFGEKIRVFEVKLCKDKAWMQEGSHEWRGEKTKTKNLDAGKVIFLEDGLLFKSFVFRGSKLTGYWILKQEDDEWYFSQSSLPGELLLLANVCKRLQIGPQPLEEFVFEEEEDRIFVRLHDIRDFSACEPDWVEYQEFLSFNVPKGVELNICIFPVPGTIHM